MARVIVDFIPPIDETEPDIKLGVNKSLAKANEILRLLSTGINTVEFGNGTTTENMYVDYVSVEFGTAGAELSAAHSLLKTPTSIVGQKLDRPADIYFSKAATSTNIYLKSDTDSASGTIVIA